MSGDDSPIDQFDLTYGMDFDLSAEEIAQFADELREAEAVDFDEMGNHELAAYVDAIKRLEDAAEEARKEFFEPALDDRVGVGQGIGNLRRVQRTNRFVTDDMAAIEAIEDAGGDPMSVASVKASDFRDVAKSLGINPDEYLGETEYTYYRREG